MVETYYIRMGQIESYGRRYLTHFPRMMWSIFANTIKLPAHIISEYRYDNNEQYRKKIDALDALQKAKEDVKTNQIKEQLKEFIRQDLEKEKMGCVPIFIMTLLDKIRKSLKQYHLINDRDKILIGVSGGADSVGLLYTLNRLKDEFKLKLYVAHLNHSLRGRESDQDQEFVKKLSEKLKIPAFFKKVDVLAAAKTYRSEEAARKIRFDFLFQTAHENRIVKIALGHNQDDQAETVLMRL